MGTLHLRARLTLFLLLGVSSVSQAQPWTDEPLAAGRPVRSRYIRELRDAIDAKRGPSGCNLPASRPWRADIAPGAKVGVLWINELRQAIRDLSNDLGMSTPPTFTPPDPIPGGAGVPIRPRLVSELRRHVERLRAAPCPGPSCVCDAAWTNDSCGTSGCAATEMHQSRSCAPSGCLPQSRCVPDSACLGACTYGAWRNTGDCGSGGCDQDERPQIQAGVPASCPARFQCNPARECGCANIPRPSACASSAQCCAFERIPYWICPNSNQRCR